MEEVTSQIPCRDKQISLLTDLFGNVSLKYLCTHFRFFIIISVNSQYLKVKDHAKLLISQSKFSGPRKFTL